MSDDQKRNMGDLWFRNGVLGVDMWYPRLGVDGGQPREFDHPVTVEVGLSDVRAADSIRIEYDFARDGYSIKQASVFQWEVDDEVCDADWQEVAFVQAWARQVDPDEGNEDAQRLLNQINVAHSNAKAALGALPPTGPTLGTTMKVLVAIARGQLQAAVNHLEQAWSALSETTKGERDK